MPDIQLKFQDQLRHAELVFDTHDDHVTVSVYRGARRNTPTNFIITQASIIRLRKWLRDAQLQLQGSE